ncbi:MAG: segregation/condensation protein A [Defluviitaleaceae bacterium]|nr:segregation/condensation protein A [Defluviitaleaceae bacterium]
MEYKLDSFEGPLDLLLKLIDKNEIDIFDIPIAKLTDQYIAAITQMHGGLLRVGEEQMEGAGEFILMAATLLAIKSRMLLPKPPSAPEIIEDPREELVRRLLAYKECKQAAATLGALGSQAERITRPPDITARRSVDLFRLEIACDASDVMGQIGVEALYRVFSDVMRRVESRVDSAHADYGEMFRERFTVEMKIKSITELLAVRGNVTLGELFCECETREEAIVTFLAVLELMRSNSAAVSQRRQFGAVTIAKAG